MHHAHLTDGSTCSSLTMLRLSKVDHAVTYTTGHQNSTTGRPQDMHLAHIRP